jgi:hypothetical protein
MSSQETITEAQESLLLKDPIPHSDMETVLGASRAFSGILDLAVHERALEHFKQRKLVNGEVKEPPPNHTAQVMSTVKAIHATDFPRLGSVLSWRGL